MSVHSFVLNETILPLSFAPMCIGDLNEVCNIEQRVYSHPWTYGNCADAISSGYQCWVLRDGECVLLGYFFLMQVLDEAHLLNISVHGDWHRCGIGRKLLDKALAVAREKAMVSMLLEVRPSNTRALYMYQRYGFTKIGLRRDYYPASDNRREDAIVMRMSL